ncbi:GNAT family N-acetyltransferase [Pontivivens ytuae]|uniref:GNAT family N-acetyltransferase n=1 Tax=Pontivivens ytuae TaxID=2789856 RepID=A0A7S9LTJ5_9RHOB|nr:GNAT family N-acetyltransferase [Pontivivens ytuae]QPH54480.1 GNAT family N-acetyltransferase [Pontivivens ytuae]
MTLHRAGEEVAYTVTWLEMTARPSYPRPHAPIGKPVALLKAEHPPVWFFLDLYRAVGAPYEWTDRLRQPVDEVADYVQDPQLHHYTLMREGWPAGFFHLDFREAGECDLAYFGLVPEAVGAGLGQWLLQTAIHMAWDGPGVQKVLVNTCTLDHPAALPLYQKQGFVPVAQEEATRILSADREM